MRHDVCLGTIRFIGRLKDGWQQAAKAAGHFYLVGCSGR
jgi:hypothetical protein